MNVGIVGVGFVGNAVLETSRQFFPTETFDIDTSKSTFRTLDGLVKYADLIFVALPTPMQKDGQCDTRIIESVVKQIAHIAETLGEVKSVVIKSTIPVGTTYSMENPYLRLTFNPEFLTERNAVEDFKNQTRIILGGYSQEVAMFYMSALPLAKIVVTEPAVAEAVKYGANVFLALKVAFSNELKDYLDSMDVSHEKVTALLKEDDRLGKTHWDVPGPDGKRGFGGTCFPKDTMALLSEMEACNVDSTILQAMWKKNILLRPERDWEQLKGRAVSE